MQNEKLPKDYYSSVVQKVIEGIKNGVGLAAKKASQELADTAQEIKDSISQLARKVQNLAEEGEGEQGKAAIFVPPPQNLTGFEFGTWGFAHVDPFFRWKYKGRIVGYEFYGSMNLNADGDFDVHESEYVGAEGSQGRCSTRNVIAKWVHHQRAEFEGKGILLVLRGTSWRTMSQEGEISASTNRSCVWSLAGMEEETVWRIYMD